MWEKLRVVWQIPELRQKILLTLGLLAIYRLGFQIPLPIVDPAKVQALGHQRSAGGMTDVMQQVAVFSASQLTQVTIFGLGIMPYISASIIFQLLGSVYPPLEELAKRRRGGPQENQRIYALRDGAYLPDPKLDLCECLHRSDAAGRRGLSEPDDRFACR